MILWAVEGEQSVYVATRFTDAEGAFAFVHPEAGTYALGPLTIGSGASMRKVVSLGRGERKRVDLSW